jgi:ubiquitin carboxyl-terminal hydrolase 16
MLGTSETCQSRTLADCRDKAPLLALAHPRRDETATNRAASPPLGLTAASALETFFTTLARYGAAISAAFTPAPPDQTTSDPKHSVNARERTLVAIAGTGLLARNMPEKPLTIATYAAGASLAAITLVYVFGPTFFLDDEAANSSKSSRKKGVVGLVNPANDCFINSVLQALAGLPELRTYLIREIHRRKLDGTELYNSLEAVELEERKNPSSTKVPEWKTLGLQQGLVTAGLKEVLDALNERPIYKKTISAQSFIRCVEQAFRTRISRTQQDAQEFLQVVVERLAEEYAAGKRARDYATKHGSGRIVLNEAESGDQSNGERRPRDSKMLSFDVEGEPATEDSSQEDDDSEKDDIIFPLEGKMESQVECSHCHFKPKPTVSSFLSLTLNVPHDSTSSTLNQCFDGMFKVEYIDDFKCDRCRLEHALQVNAKQLSRASEEDRPKMESDRAKIETALQEDPEKPPEGVRLPDLSTVPKRRISRHTRISSFPRVLAVHLSRSVWDPSSASSKNMAKVSFPETLPLGGLLDRKTYRLLGVVTHKGGHNSGHYESFRRQMLNPPFSTPASMGTEGVYSLRNSPAPSPRVSAVPSPQLRARSSKDITASGSDSPSLSTDSQFLSTPTSATPTSSSASSTLQPLAPAAVQRRKQAPPIESVPTPGLPTPPQQVPPPELSKTATNTTIPVVEEPAPPKTRITSIRGRKKNINDRWWRISDDKIKESKTSEVLGMQREVYMLFYEVVES